MTTLAHESIPESLIQLCEAHPDRTFHVHKESRGKDQVGTADTQEQLPKWGLVTYSLQPRHPLAAWLWLKDPMFRVSPSQLRQRMFLDAVTEWQVRCDQLDFPRTFSRKKANEGFGTMRPDIIQVKSVLFAMERWSHEEAILWILWNDEEKKLAFLDDKKFPRADGYKNIWILREPRWDRLWDASNWKPRELVQWLQEQEKAGFKVEWPLEPSSTTQKILASEYERLGFSAAGLSKDELRLKVGRTKAIKALCAMDTE